MCMGWFGGATAREWFHGRLVAMLAMQVAINWCMCKGTVPIPGAKDLAQAQENLGALGWRLSSGEVAELDTAAGRIKKGMVQNVFQTK